MKANTMVLLSALVVVLLTGCDSGAIFDPPIGIDPPLSGCGVNPAGNWQVTYLPVSDGCALGSEMNAISIEVIHGDEIVVTEEGIDGCMTTTSTCSNGEVSYDEIQTFPGPGNCTIEVSTSVNYAFTSDSTAAGDMVADIRCIGDCPLECGSCTSAFSVSAIREGSGPACS